MCRQYKKGLPKGSPQRVEKVLRDFFEFKFVFTALSLRWHMFSYYRNHKDCLL